MIFYIVNIYLKKISMINFKKKTILITGAAGQIGSYLASYFDKEEANLILIDNNNVKIKNLKNKIKSKNNYFYNCNLAKYDQLKDLTKKIKKKFKKIDVIIHSASLVGTSKLKGWNTKFSDQSIDNWDETFKINLYSIFYLVQKLEKNLIKSNFPSVINVGSIYSKSLPDWNMYKKTNIYNPAAYSSSKAALAYLTKWLAATVHKKIRCNMISPGGIEGNQNVRFKKNYIKKVPLKRMTQIEDLLGPIIFLSSDMSNYITGQNIFVDGGFAL